MKLKFGWPEDLSVRVVSNRRVEKDKLRPIATAVTWRFHVSGLPAGLGVHLDAVEVHKLSGGLEEAVLDGALVFQSVLPSLALDASGAFARLTNPGQSRALILSSTLDALPAHVDEAKAKAFFAELLEDDRLDLAARNNWASLVFALIGKEFNGDDTYASVADVPVPLVGTPVQFDNVIRARGRLPCFQGDREARCIWIEMDSKPRGKVLDNALARARKQMPLATPEITSLRARYQTEIVTEVDRLVPHWFHLRQVSDITFVHEGTLMLLHQVQDRTDSFHYEKGSVD